MTSALLRTSCIGNIRFQQSSKRVGEATDLYLQVDVLQIIFGLVLPAVDVHLDSKYVIRSGIHTLDRRTMTYSCFNCAIPSFIRPSNASTSRLRAEVADRMAAVSFLVKTPISVRSSDKAALNK